MAVVVPLAGCQSSAGKTAQRSEQRLRTTGVLTGDIGPGVPPHGAVPDLTLIFTSRKGRFQSAAEGGHYRVELPAGTWTVRSTDGRACATGVTVGASAEQRTDLVYPGECLGPG